MHAAVDIGICLSCQIRSWKKMARPRASNPVIHSGVAFLGAFDEALTQAMGPSPLAPMSSDP